MKRICMITQSPYPFDPRVRREAEVLAKAGYEVDIFCIRYDGQSKVESFGNITAHRIMKHTNQENIVRYLLTSSIFFLKSFFKLQLLHSKRKYSIVQIHNMPDYHVFTTIFQKLQGVKIVLDIHDLTPELFDAKWSGKKGKIFSKVVRIIEQRSCKFADEVITVTAGCKEKLVGRGTPEEKVTLVLNTPDTSIFKFSRDRNYSKIKKDLKLLYHGTIAERFGIHLAVESMKYVKEFIPGSIFFVYGKYDDSYKKKLEKQIADLGLKENVFLLGRRSLEEISDIIKDCDIGVVPYESNEYMNLALSTKTFEYAAAGLPVVATDLETLKKTFGKSALTYVKDGEPIELADNIYQLAMNPEKRKTQVEAAKNAISMISWDIMAGRYLSLMRRLMNEESLMEVKHPHKKIKKSESVY